LLDTSTAL